MTGKRKKSSSHSSTKNLSDPLGKTRKNSIFYVWFWGLKVNIFIFQMIFLNKQRICLNVHI